jgi:cytochrome c peroxidase
MDAKEPDPGRQKVSGKDEEFGAFKTPSLRSVTKSAPYFHDGSAATLEDAVKVMLAGGKRYKKNALNKHLDPRLQPVKLTDKEFEQLMAFLSSLTSTESFERPTLP